MIHVFGNPEAPLPRLLSALAHRGHALARGTAGAAAGDGPSTLVLTAAAAVDALALGVLLGAWRRTPDARVLVVGAVGAHPDARLPRLRTLWELEENVRSTRLPVLVLRLGPLVGPDSPLWQRLRSAPRLGRAGGALVQPVAESAVIETLDRALSGRARWDGWWECVGPDAMTLDELATVAREAGPRLPAGSGEWEPALEELASQRLAEGEPWLAHFGLEPRPVPREAGAWR